MQKIKNFLKNAVLPIFLTTPVAAHEITNTPDGIAANGISFSKENLDIGVLECVRLELTNAFGLGSFPNLTLNDDEIKIDVKFRLIVPEQLSQFTYEVTINFADDFIYPSVNVSDNFNSAQSAGYFLDDNGRQTNKPAIQSEANDTDLINYTTIDAYHITHQAVLICVGGQTL